MGMRKPGKNRSKAVSSDQRGLFADWVRNIIAGLGALVVAAIGVWVSPLKDIALQRMYPERADVALIADKTELKRGQTLKLDVQITQKSAFPITPGVVEITIEGAKLAPVPGRDLRVSTKEIAGIYSLPNENAFLLSLADHTSGRAKIKARLITRHAVFESNEVVVGVLGDVPSAQPFLEQHGSLAINLSGEWRIEVSAMTGTMKIKQLPNGNVTGSFELQVNGNTKVGSIDGFKDGTTFRVFYYVKKPLTETWRVEGNFALNANDKRFVEITGCAYSIVKDPTITEEKGSHDLNCQSKRDYFGWRGVATYRYYAVSQLQG